MYPSDITDPKAILSAIAECDALGRQAFLEKYGFAEAKDYFLLYQGKRYDSKAIVGAAHGFEHPDEGPLTRDVFSGGKGTVAPLLQRLGFQVDGPSAARTANIWALCANPNRYRIQDAVQHLEIDYWVTGRSALRAGDHVVIWQTQDKRGQRGIIALGEVLADPEVRLDTDNPYWTDPEDGATLLPRVPVRYISARNLPLWAKDREHGDFVSSLSVARATGGAVFRITPEQWQTIVEITEYEPTAPEAVEEEDRRRGRQRHGSGQGFGLTAEERRAVELHAMWLATRYYEQTWDSVQDVSSRASYDLHCRSNSKELRVEVKGMTGGGGRIILTDNEVGEASRPGYALFVVTGIVLDRSDPAAPRASAGDCVVFSGLDLVPSRLKPTQYSYLPDWPAGVAVTVPLATNEDNQ